jgi:hypothetical protein
VIGARIPSRVTEIEPHHRATLKRELRRRWPHEVAGVYRSFAWAVAAASAERWRDALRERSEETLWRLLRLEAAPYFVLGTDQKGGRLHYRIATPWDFRDRFRLRAFEVLPEAAGQPVVLWRAEVDDRRSGERRVSEGHVEIRWSHGRFSGAPEAKVYLDTGHHDVAGYFPLV